MFGGFVVLFLCVRKEAVVHGCDVMTGSMFSQSQRRAPACRLGLFQRPSLGGDSVRVEPHHKHTRTYTAPHPKFLWPCLAANGTRLMEAEPHHWKPPDVGFCADSLGKIFSPSLLARGHFTS